jgi:formamidopyrimidine-DNA glycosylase
MPELPEVQTFKKYFDRTSLHKKITNVTCKSASLIKKASYKQVQKTLIGKEFISSKRKGKFLIATIQKSPYKLVFHFGMTGSLAYGKEDKLSIKDKKYAKFIINFPKDYELLWIDKRKFGKIYLVKDIKEVKTLAHMGPDALSLTKTQFLKLLKEKEAKNIKAFLMDQQDIAGIGNNYSNEILFQSGIDPHKKIKELSTKERTHMYTVMKNIFKKAISLKPTGDTSYSEFPNSWLLAHKKDMRCPKNKNHKLSKTTIAGRSAIYCKTDQK